MPSEKELQVQHLIEGMTQILRAIKDLGLPKDPEGVALLTRLQEQVQELGDFLASDRNTPVRFAQLRGNPPPPYGIVVTC